jgi:hypothetical protein
VSFEPLPPHVPAGLERRFSASSRRATRRAEPETIRIKLASGHAGTISRYRGLKALIGRTLSSHADRGRWYDVSERFVAYPQTDAMFARHRPTLVAVATPGLIFAEIPVLRTAVRQRVPSVAVDLSWDNLTNKLFPIRKVDRLVVWNSTMRREAHEFHRYPLADIDVAGPPQFDCYFNGESRCGRVEFCRRVGLDPARRIVTLTTIPAESYPRHDVVIDHLVDAIRSHALAAPCDLLVRVHPRDDVRQYRFTPARRTCRWRSRFARPRARRRPQRRRHRREHAASRRHDVSQRRRPQRRVDDLDRSVDLRHADREHRVRSDDAEARPFLTSPLRYYSYTHYQQIVQAGAVRIAKSAREMIAEINAYLADPSRDAAGRRRVVAEQCEFTDGRSAERLAGVIARELSGRRLEAAGNAARSRATAMSRSRH